MLFQSLFHSLSLMNPASMQHQGRNKSTDRKTPLVIQYIHVVGEPHFFWAHADPKPDRVTQLQITLPPQAR